MRAFDHRSGRAVEMDDGARVYVEETGDAGGPALLLLHGGFGNLEDFNSLLAGADAGGGAGGYRVIGIDSRGHGGSTRGRERMTYARLARDVETVLGRLGVARTAVLGFSDGGIVGYRLAAATRPTGPAIDRLVTVGADWHANSLEALRPLFRAITGESWRAKFPETYEAYRRWNPEPDFDRFARDVAAMWLDEDPASGYPNAAVDAIACPLLVVRGDEDHLMSRGAAYALAERVPGARLLNVPFAGHAAHDDRPEVFRSVLDRFLCEG